MRPQKKKILFCDKLKSEWLMVIKMKLSGTHGWMCGSYLDQQKRTDHGVNCRVSILFKKKIFFFLFFVCRRTLHIARDSHHIPVPLIQPWARSSINPTSCTSARTSGAACLVARRRTAQPRASFDACPLTAAPSACGHSRIPCVRPTARALICSILSHI